MNGFIFTGPPGAGKTFIAKYCAKLLSSMGKKVAVIDMTKRRGLYYDLLIDEMSHDTFALSYMANKAENKAFAYSNIDIFTEEAGGIIEFKDFFFHFSRFHDQYDLMLIVVDLKHVYEVAFMQDNLKLFLVQDFDRYNMCLSLKALIRLSKNINKEVPRITMIYNKVVNCKLSRLKIEESIMFTSHSGNMDKLLLNISQDEIVIPFSIKDYIADLDNNSDGVIEIRRLTSKTRKNIQKICNSVCASMDENEDEDENENENENEETKREKQGLKRPNILKGLMGRGEEFGDAV